MAISIVHWLGDVSTAVIPGDQHQTGDLIVAFAFRDGSATPPSLPSGQGWLSPANSTRVGTSCSDRVAYKIATSNSEGVGIFTNATSLLIVVIRGADQTTPIGATVANSGSSTTVNFAALTLEITDGSSVVLGFCGHRSTNVAIETAPSGMVNVGTVSDATDEAAVHASPSGVSSWTSQNASVGGTSSGWTSRVIEIRAEPLPPPANDQAPRTMIQHKMRRAA